MKEIVLIREMQTEELTIHRTGIWYLLEESEDE